MIADAVQMLTLALPIGGMFLILFSLGRGLVKKVWAWGEGSLAKRAVGTLGLATLAALIALLRAIRADAYRPRLRLVRASN